MQNMFEDGWDAGFAAARSKTTGYVVLAFFIGLQAGIGAGCVLAYYMARV